ncbi:MAG TPA: tRNA (adenosine(37)-N6)-threonylcarbamoyltransferase complex transferase subunit TsaD [Acidimicrobiia bacterium]|nr:tRNA (adenosine(37)-N6)-threonylcarbamoyltransferase complex transferase subunit TsaD [Acidimicrobiia bacterium]
MRVLGIETSCDETAAAVVDYGRLVRSSVVASQADLHARYGGVVPEIASRAHVELICDVIEEALVEAGSSLGELDAVAAVRGPGLAGALLVGVSAAKAISIASALPYVAVHHHEAHLYAAMIEDPQLEPPLVTLIVSGGHTLLIAMDGHGSYRVLGQTVDDAAGEAFDKVARFLGLGYPGGPAIDRLAREGDPEAIRFPRPMRTDGLDFSFSGLKTAVVQYVRKHPEAEVADIAASFQAAIVDVLVEKLQAAALQVGIDTVVAGGGVAANSALRARLAGLADTGRLKVVLPSIDLCTDNAAMVAAVGAYRLAADGPTPLEAPVVPNLRLV